MKRDDVEVVFEKIMGQIKNVQKLKKLRRWKNETIFSHSHTPQGHT